MTDTKMTENLPFSLIISDLHLDQDRPDSLNCFMSFMQHDAPKAEKLFILGDFFEFWVGDDDKNPFNQQIIDTLKDLSNKGVALYFMHGNRDFLIGQDFAHETGMTLLEDPCVMDFYGQKILLSHGDLFCTDDKSYQRFRKFCHINAFQRLFLRLSIPRRLNIALRMRIQSIKNHTLPEVADVNKKAILKAFAKHQTDIIIHGHTHRLKKHDYAVNNKVKYRYVLGDWHAVGSALKIDTKGVQFLKIRQR